MACHQMTAPPTWQFQSSRHHWLRWKSDEQWPLGLSIGWESYHPVKEQRHSVASTYHWVVFLQCFHARSLQSGSKTGRTLTTPGEISQKHRNIRGRWMGLSPLFSWMLYKTTAVGVRAWHQSQLYFEWHQTLQSLELSLKGTFRWLQSKPLITAGLSSKLDLVDWAQTIRPFILLVILKPPSLSIS